MNNKVSILIVSYNAERFIKNTVLSCLKQTYENIEVLILDNASSDDTSKIIELIKNDKIRLFKGDKNLGPYDGLNFLLNRALGEYVAIQDHDDIWFPEKIEEQVEFLEKNSEYVACGTNNYNFYEKKELLILNKKPFAETGNNYVPHSSLVFRNKGFRYDTSKILADEYFEKKILTKEGKIYLIKDAYVIHRIREDGGNLSLKRFKISQKAIKEFFEINEFSFKSFIYLCILFISKITNEKLRFFIEKDIIKRKNKQISLEDFKNKFENIKI